jgi:RHS repeat-associated protein
VFLKGTVFAALLLQTIVLLPSMPEFSSLPSDEEIYRQRVFPIPLRRVEDLPSPSPAENRDLAAALARYGRSATGDPAPLVEFLQRHPGSAWRPSLLGNLGLLWRRAGRFQKAIDAFEETWELTRRARGVDGHAIGDWAAGELAKMHSHLGHGGRVRKLLREIEGRQLMGPATEYITAAREALVRSHLHPEGEYRCGPMALASLLRHRGLDPPAELLSAKGSRRGMSLSEVEALGRQVGLKVRAIHREPGSAVPVPSVVHWKVDHYSAIVAREQQNGQEMFLVENPLFEDQIWVSRKALDDETSGYFLAPEGAVEHGWRDTGPAETGEVFGRCWRGELDDEETRCTSDKIGGSIPGCPRCACVTPPKGMPVYRFHTMLISLNIVDRPIGYTPPVGPAVNFTLTYNQREAYQPALFSFANLGNKWTFDWMSYVVDGGPSSLGRIYVYLRGGGLELHDMNSRVPGFRLASSRPHYQSQSYVTVAEGRTNDAYQRRLPDGSREIFSLIENTSRMPLGSRRIFLTEIVDPAGNSIKLTYDARFRVVSVTDAIGQVTRLSYDLASDPLKITRVTDPFGRAATFGYDNQRRLVKITDPVGIVTEFLYDGDFINAMTTPYGVTTFRAGRLTDPFLISSYAESNRWIEATDPHGDTERLEFRSRLEPLPARLRDGSLYWDKKVWKERGRDFAHARLIRWKLVGGTLMSGVPWTVKSPLEGDIEFTYPRQEHLDQLASLRIGDEGIPASVERNLEDGTRQVERFEYNIWGKFTRTVDPAGRAFTFAYSSDGVDLVEVFNEKTRERVMRATYNSQHLPLTVTGASGQTRRATYNSRGQPLTVTNAGGDTVTFAYDGNGFLLSETGPLTEIVTRYTYDSAGRLRTATDPDGYRVTLDYDALDRPTRISYADGTFEQIRYDRLDPVEFTDRAGRVTRVTYDSLRRITSVTDPLGQTTRMNWCNCGGLAELVDPAGRVTTWERDLEGRVTAKILPDGATTRYEYGPVSGRLLRVVDPKGQGTRYEYTADDYVRRVSFDNTAVPTPPVTISYDPNWERLVRVEDDTGVTDYTYHPVGSRGALQLAAVTGQVPGSRIEYSYDELGRLTRRSVNGVAADLVYDTAGRVTRLSNALGDFAMTYQGASGRLVSMAYPGGQRSRFEYAGASGNFQLRQLQHLAADGTVLSQFDYGFLPGGELASQRRYQPGFDPAVATFTYRYDAAGQLVAAALVAEDGTSLGTFDYGYDPAGNRTNEDRRGVARSLSFNHGNQLTQEFEQDQSREFRYDANGNLIGDGRRTFEWDALNRLVAIAAGERRSEFCYDAWDRRVRVIEKNGGDTLSDTWQLWCGGEVCEERAATGDGSATQRRFFPQGEMTGEARLFYTVDHLGSVRQLTDGQGSVTASFDYDPWGRMVRAGAEIDPALAFAGYRWHTPSGLALTHYRAYDPDLGRWLSRDPLGEEGEDNLYAYAGNDPVNRLDPLGLKYIVAPGSSKYFKFRFNQDLKALRKSCIFRALEKDLNDLPITVQYSPNHTFFNPITQALHFNPDLYVAYKNGKVPPMLSLAHELGHAHRFNIKRQAWGPELATAVTIGNKLACKRFDGFENHEEFSTIIDYEHWIARELRMFQRPDHLGSRQIIRRGRVVRTLPQPK